MSDLVSIIMPSYNTAQYITETIQSVIDQTYHNWELIIVDDCSTDNTDIVIGKIKDPRIRYIKNEKNSGAAVSRNRALREANGRWVAFLDSDDLWKPEKLEKQLRHWLLTTISYHDEQESYYHGFVTGLVSGFADYEVLSNIESGESRFDLVVKQRSDAEYAAILEFKIAKTYKEMSAKCDEALRQIEEKNYIAGLQDELYRNVSKYGICFCKKRCQVKFGGVDRFEY